jgi:hypothetical protein
VLRVGRAGRGKTYHCRACRGLLGRGCCGCDEDEVEDVDCDILGRGCCGCGEVEDVDCDMVGRGCCLLFAFVHVSVGSKKLMLDVDKGKRSRKLKCA